MKKFFAILLSAMLMLSLAVPAMAADTYSITINNPVAGYTYAAYQLFKGDLEDVTAVDPDKVQTNNKLSNIEWGSSVSNATALGNAADYAKRLAMGYTETDKLALDAFITLITLGSPVKTVNTQTGSTYVIEGLEPGYYLIKNTVVPNDGAYTEYIVEVVENSTVTAKADVPEVTKKVDDKNDSNTSEDGETWQDSADYDIGDDVPFQLTATLADNVTAYKTYKVVFHDTLSSGLTYNNDAVVKLGGTVIYDANDEANASEGVTVTHSNGILTITITDAKRLGAENSSVITVEYTAKLNEGAVVGSAGNSNTVKLEYSNDPDNTSEGDNTGITPEDKVVVFTYKLTVNKVNEDEEALEGAGFTLYKWYETKAAIADDPTTDENEAVDAEGEWKAVGTEIKGDKLTTFTWSGLDDGKYKLVETTTPAGYNTIDPIEFVITAEHDVTSDDPKLTNLDSTFEEADENTTAGTVTGTVKNQAGSTLPETGGMGTTIFYAVGGLMVVAAVVLLVTKKRMSAEG